MLPTCPHWSQTIFRAGKLDAGRRSPRFQLLREAPTPRTGAWPPPLTACDAGRTWTEAADGDDDGLLGEPVGASPRPARPPLGVRPLPAPGAEATGVEPMVGAGAEATVHDWITAALHTATRHACTVNLHQILLLGAAAMDCYLIELHRSACLRLFIILYVMPQTLLLDPLGVSLPEWTLSCNNVVAQNSAPTTRWPGVIGQAGVSCAAPC